MAFSDFWNKTKKHLKKARFVWLFCFFKISQKRLKKKVFHKAVTTDTSVDLEIRKLINTPPVT